WDWLILRYFRTWITPLCRTIPWPMQKNGPLGWVYQRMQLTIRPLSSLSTEQSKWSPKAIGNGLRPNTLKSLHAIRVGELKHEALLRLDTWAIFRFLNHRNSPVAMLVLKRSATLSFCLALSSTAPRRSCAHVKPDWDEYKAQRHRKAVSESSDTAFLCLWALSQL